MDSWPPGSIDTDLSNLQKRYLPDVPHYDITGLLNDSRLGSAALVSSFGAESVILLHFVSRIRPNVAVLFLDTGKHFPETLLYRDQLAERLNLNLHVVTPSKEDLAQEDPYGALHTHDANACCRLRKVFPLQDVLGKFDTWISGQKRYQSSSRANVPILERDGVRLKVNPLAMWSKQDIVDYRKLHDLPSHPLEAQNYFSIGCAPCTNPVQPGEDPRNGRWASSPDKTECGLHLGPSGGFHRKS